MWRYRYLESCKAREWQKIGAKLHELLKMRVAADYYEELPMLPRNHASVAMAKADRISAALDAVSLPPK